MSEWKEVKLGDYIDMTNGYAFKSKSFVNRGIPVLKIKNIKTNKIIIEDIDYISADDNNPRYTIIKPNDLIITMTGNRIDGSPETWVGKVALFNLNGKYFLNQRLSIIRVKKDLVNLLFILYSLTTIDAQKYFITHATSSGGQANISPDIVKNFTIKLPSYIIQSEIAGILSSLDAKIETNNKLNEKLEEMAQAIFKSWFVDFEPFKDKPFHETELGMIPEGWEVSTFSSIIEKLISGDWGKETPTGNYVHKVACIRGCDFENIKNGLRGKTPERFILERNFALKQPKPNDIVVEMSGGTATVSTGRICYITKELLDQYEGDIVCTNFCKIVRPLKGWSQYLYYYWQYKYDKKVMFCYENGTSGIKNFAINDFIDFESILIPPKDELIKFNSIIDNIRVKIQMNGVENTRLASLRDTLLPRLMSGELIV